MTDDNNPDKMMEIPTGSNIDIRDVEFRFQHDPETVRSLLSGITSAATSRQDLVLLKLILASCLSPQVPLADEFNHDKSSNQVFHTREKPHVGPHPMGVFANHPDPLQLADQETVDVPGFILKLPVPGKDQILLYVTLLEESSPAIKMKEKDIQQLERKIDKMQRDQHFFNFIDFTQTQILFTIKRLSAADMNIIYRGHAEGEDHFFLTLPIETKCVDMNWIIFKAAPYPRKISSYTDGCRSHFLVH